ALATWREATHTLRDMGRRMGRRTREPLISRARAREVLQNYLWDLQLTVMADIGCSDPDPGRLRGVRLTYLDQTPEGAYHRKWGGVFGSWVSDASPPVCGGCACELPPTPTGRRPITDICPRCKAAQWYAERGAELRRSRRQNRRAA